MVQEPEKPKHYVRDYLLIFLVGLIILAGSISFDAPKFYTSFVPLMFVIFFPLYWFRDYNNKKRQYDEYLITQWKDPRRETKRSVNENIALYVKKQKEKKALAKWWQFWV